MIIWLNKLINVGKKNRESALFFSNRATNVHTIIHPFFLLNCAEIFWPILWFITFLAICNFVTLDYFDFFAELQRNNWLVVIEFFKWSISLIICLSKFWAQLSAESEANGFISTQKNYVQWTVQMGWAMSHLLLYFIFSPDQLVHFVLVSELSVMYRYFFNFLSYYFEINDEFSLNNEFD